MLLRTALTSDDPARIEQLVVRAGVFHAEEIDIARSLAEETLLRGSVAGYDFLIADGPNRIDAYTCYGRIPGTNRRFELYWIAVDPHVQRSGMARMLLRATEDAARAQGATHLFAETSGLATYRPAHAFYACSGYSLLATIPDYHADGDGLLVFGKRL